MKIIFDFDGTVTDISHDATRILEITDELISNLPYPLHIFHHIYQTALNTIEQAPHQYGWCHGDRISAFADEDPSTMIIAVMTLIGQGPAICPEIDEFRHALALHDTDMTKLAEQSWTIMNSTPFSATHLPMPDAVHAIRALTDAQHEVVIVSNSPESRIIEKLNRTGLHPAPHATCPDAKFRVRGGANKFKLSDSPTESTFASRTVATDRPAYKAVLLDERPDVIIGDVFSLDLALPISLALSCPDFGTPRICLKSCPYTPKWAKEAVKNYKNGFILDDFDIP